jgi:hypothetical protein
MPYALVPAKGNQRTDNHRSRAVTRSLKAKSERTAAFPGNTDVSPATGSVAVVLPVRCEEAAEAVRDHIDGAKPESEKSNPFPERRRPDWQQLSVASLAMIFLSILTDADLLREMIGFAAQLLMEPEVGGQTGATYGEITAERLTQRKGCWERI